MQSVIKSSAFLFLKINIYSYNLFDFTCSISMIYTAYLFPLFPLLKSKLCLDITFPNWIFVFVEY